MSSPGTMGSFSIIHPDDPIPSQLGEAKPLREMRTYRESPPEPSDSGEDEGEASVFNTSRLPRTPPGQYARTSPQVAFLAGENGESTRVRITNLSPEAPRHRRFPSMSDLRAALPDGGAGQPPSPAPTIPLRPAPSMVGGVPTSRRLTVLNLPHPGARDAPKTFHGDCDEVEAFLSHYEKLIQTYNLTSDRERCRSIVQYCSSSVGDFIRVTDSYLSDDWQGLKREIYKWYNAEVALKRFKPIHVAEYVKQHSREPIFNLTQFNKYYVGFKKRSGRLVSEGLMGRAKEAWYFKNGIHPDLWDKIQGTLASLNPLHDPAIPYSIQDICAAADVRLKRENFDDMQEDADRFGIVPEDVPSDSDDDSEGDSESDYSEKEYRRRRKERRRRAEKKKRKGVKSERVKKDKLASSPEEVSNLVRQLNRLRPDEQAYPVIVLQNGQSTNGLAGGFAPASTPQVRFVEPGSQLQRPSQTSSLMQQRSLPPHMNNGLGPRVAQSSESPCYGCRGYGHHIRNCEDLNRLLRENRVKRDSLTGRVVLLNGCEIKPEGGENLVQAILRITSGEGARTSNLYYAAPEHPDGRARTYYATVSKPESDISEDEGRYAKELNVEALFSAYNARVGDREVESEDSCEEDEVEDEGGEEGTWIEDEEGKVYRVVRSIMPATRNDRSAAASRKEFMNEPVRRPGLRPPVPRLTVPSKQREFRKSDANRAAPPGSERRDRDAGWPKRAARTAAAPGPENKDGDVSMGNAEGNVNGRGERESLAPLPAPPPPVPAREKPVRGTLSAPNPFDLLPPLRPVNARAPRLRQESTGLPMGQGAPTPAPPPGRSSGAFEPTEESTAKGRGPARVAPIALDTDPKEIVNKVLGQEITLTVGEFLGSSSRDVQKEFRGVLQPKSVPRAGGPENGALVHTAVTSPTPSRTEVYAVEMDEDNLIRLDLLCEGTPVHAIIDTGSQLNVMRESLAQKILVGMPLDTAGALTMNDANGGAGYISGVMKQVRLDLGQIKTKTDIYLGAKVPFDLLLGRPWQRGNKISIDERDEGTYLIFRDPDTGEKRYELRVPRRPRGQKGDRRGTAAMLDEREARETKAEVESVRGGHWESRARNSYYVASHQITSACAEANRDPQKENKVPPTRPFTQWNEWRPYANLSSATNRLWGLAILILLCAFVYGSAAYSFLDLDGASSANRRTGEGYKRGIACREKPLLPHFQTSSLRLAGARSYPRLLSSYSNLMNLSDAPLEQPNPSFPSQPPFLSVNTTVIPLDQFPDRVGPALPPLEPPIHGSLDPPAQISEVTRRLDEAAARDEHPGRLFIFSGRGASLGGGRDSTGRYVHDVAIPSGTQKEVRESLRRSDACTGTCLSSDPTGRHVASMEDLFVRCYTQTRRAPFNDPLLEAGSNGILSHPPSVEEVDRLLPTRGPDDDSALNHCNVPVVVDTRRLQPRPLTPIRGASSLPPYYAPRPWTDADVAEPRAPPASPADSAITRATAGSAAATGGDYSVDATRTLGPALNGIHSPDTVQPLVLAAFARPLGAVDTADDLLSDHLPSATEDGSTFDVFAYLDELERQRRLRSVSPVERSAADAMVVDSPRWVPSSPTDEDVRRYCREKGLEESPPWDYFLQYPVETETSLEGENSDFPSHAFCLSFLAGEPAAVLPSNESTTENAVVASPNPSAVTSSATEREVTSAVCSVPDAQDASTSGVAERGNGELTNEQRLVLYLQALPPQPALPDLLLRSPTAPSNAGSLLPPLSTASESLAPRPLQEAIAVATAALANAGVSGACNPAELSSRDQSEPATPLKTVASPAGSALVPDPLPRADTPHPRTGVFHRPAKRSRGSQDSIGHSTRPRPRFRPEERVTEAERSLPSEQVSAPRTILVEEPVRPHPTPPPVEGDGVERVTNGRGSMGEQEHEGSTRWYAARVGYLNAPLIFRSLRIPTPRGKIRLWFVPGPSPLGRSVGEEEGEATLDDPSVPQGGPPDVEMEDLAGQPLKSPPMFTDQDYVEWKAAESQPHPFAVALTDARASALSTTPPPPLEPIPSAETAPTSSQQSEEVSARPTGETPVTPPRAHATSPPPWGVCEFSRISHSISDSHDFSVNESTVSYEAQDRDQAPAAQVSTCQPPPPWRVAYPSNLSPCALEGRKDRSTPPEPEVESDDGLTDRDADGETDREDEATLELSASALHGANTADIADTARSLRALARRLHLSASLAFREAAEAYEAAAIRLEQARMASSVDEMRDALAAIINDGLPQAQITSDNLLESAEDAGALSETDRWADESSTDPLSDEEEPASDEARLESGAPNRRYPTPPATPSEHDSLPELQSQEGSAHSPSSSPRTPPRREDETPPDPSRMPNTPYEPEIVMDGESEEGAPPDYAEIRHDSGDAEPMHRTPPPPSITLPEPESVTLSRIFHKALTQTLMAHNILHEGEVDGEEVENILREITRQLQEEANPVLQLGRRRLTYEPPDLDPTLLVQQLQRHLASAEGQVDSIEDFAVRRLSRILEDPGFDVTLEAASLRTLFRCVGLDTSSNELLDWWGAIFPNAVYRAPAHLRSVSRGAVLHMHPPRDLARPSVPFGLIAPNSPGHPSHRSDWGYFVRHGWAQIDAARGFFLSVLEVAKGLVSARDWRDGVKEHMMNRTVLQPPSSPFLFVEEAQYLEGLAKARSVPLSSTSSLIPLQMFYRYNEERLAMLIQCAVRRQIPHLDGYLRGLMRCGYLGGPVEEICRIASIRQEELDGEWKKWRRVAWIKRWAPLCPESASLQQELREALGASGEGEAYPPEYVPGITRRDSNSTPPDSARTRTWRRWSRFRESAGNSPASKTLPCRFPQPEAHAFDRWERTGIASGPPPARAALISEEGTRDFLWTKRAFRFLCFLMLPFGLFFPLISLGEFPFSFFHVPRGPFQFAANALVLRRPLLDCIPFSI
ncbi:hypothetical protein EV122DRAFT_226755 [Schizophyllum commune]